MLLEAVLFIAALLAPAIALYKTDDDSSSKSYESCERIRVYPSERKAVRYYNGKEEYEY